MTAAEQVVDLPFAVAPAMPHIREYREEDAEAVARMWRGSAPAWPGGGPGGGEHSTAARVRQEQRDLNTLATYIAWAPDPEGEGGQGNGRQPREVAVGYLSLFEQPGDASAAYVGTLSAHPDWHGKGVGRDLLKAALERTVALGYTRLDLNTWAGNLKAVPLYKKSGYFWVPETSVRMENYLPLIFRLPPAQELFRQADWYRDFRRDLALRPDEEKRGKQEVYTYEWAHQGRRLRVTIDRAAQGVLALETDEFAVSATIDDPRLPVGGRREVRWRVENRSSEPLPVSILAEGEDSVRAALQVSETVAGEREWSTAVTAEQPPLHPPVGRPTNRVRSTVVVGGQAIPLALGTEVVQPVRVSFDVAGAGWLSPGVPRRLWVSAENSLDEAVSGTLRLAAPAALTLDRSALDVHLEPRRRASWPVEVTPATPGLHAIRAQAVVRPQPAPDGAGEGAPELRTRVFEQVLPSGGPGAVFVEQSETSVWIGTDRHSVQLPLRPSRDWAVSFGVLDRATEERILSHSVSIGPPFVPSVLATCTWTAHVEREAGSVTATLSTSPPTLPGLTFERVVRVSGSGLIQLVYRVLNAGPGERPITVDAGTSVRLGMVSGTQVAAPLTTGLVVQDAADFPDWEEPDLARPERYAESWMAEFGGGWVGATLWQGAKEVFAGWRSPSLTFDLGTVPPGGQAETPSLYLYAGTGDWKSVRALWRRLIDPQAPAQDPLPRPAYDLRLERFVFDAPSDEVETRLLLESELARGMAGRASVEVNGEAVAGDRVEGLSAGAPQSLPVRLTLPQRAGALPAALVFDHEREEERRPAALIRAGRAGAEVRQSQQGEGREARVTLENGRLRLTVQPGVMARLLELSVPSGAPPGSGEWVNQLHVAGPAPGTFVWFNPWYGGVHPVLSTGGGRGNTPRLQDESFTWEQAEVEGAQGVRWRGISASTLATSRQLAGLHLTVSYLLVGDGNVVAVRQKVENRSGARVRGNLSMTTFLQPGGDRTKGILAYEDGGRVRRFKRVHGGGWGSPSGWCAVAAPGGPALTLVQATPGGTLSSRDMGLEGAHPEASISLDLDPGGSRELVAYLVVATDLEEAQHYGALRWAGLV